MAYIRHFFRKERVLERCNDRGCEFEEWIRKDVEHYCCSACETEVNKNSAFCCGCGEKLTSIKEVYKHTACDICNTKFKQLQHKDEVHCPTCRNLLLDKCSAEIAKAFYKLGQRNK